MTRLLSIVVPMCNEVENAPELFRQVRQAAEAAGVPWELIFVDDGSTDGTWDVLVGLRAQDAHVRAIRLKRNYGQTPAMRCGIEAARGDIVVTMDGDLQNDPADIPRLLATLEEGYDVVCGWRYKRQDDLWSRKVPSMVANRLIGVVTGVRLHDYGCSLKAYRAEAIKRTPLYAEFHRFIPALSTLTGALIAELKVNHRPRTRGRTKYNLSRTWRVAFDMITVSLLVRFASMPLRFFGTLAIGCLAVAALCLGQSWHGYVEPRQHISQVPAGIALLGAWLAGHLFVVGFIAELCLATAHTAPDQLIALTEE